jgi:hypothetical protein
MNHKNISANICGFWIVISHEAEENKNTKIIFVADTLNHDMRFSHLLP